MRLSSVTRVFGLVPGLVRVDLAVERGEMLLVRGPNGAGKSTLLRVIATAVSPTYGSGSVLGYDLVRERDQIRRRTELLGHRTRLYEDLSAEENLPSGDSLAAELTRYLRERDEEEDEPDEGPDGPAS